VVSTPAAFASGLLSGVTEAIIIVTPFGPFKRVHDNLGDQIHTQQRIDGRVCVCVCVCVVCVCVCCVYVCVCVVCVCVCVCL